MRKTMMMRIPLFIATLSVFVLAGCGGTGSTSTSQTSASTQAITSTQAPSPSNEQPVPPFSSSQASQSDIPDTQAFVTYSSSPAKYQLDTPEGWARTTNGADVSFIDKLNGLQLTITDASSAPTADSVRNNQVVTLQQTGRAVRDVKVQAMQLPSGPAVLMTYTSNSDHNPVTGKQVRLENNTYFFFKNGKLATLTLWAPLGADNVDQWARMSRSFRWV